MHDESVCMLLGCCFFLFITIQGTVLSNNLLFTKWGGELSGLRGKNYYY